MLDFLLLFLIVAAFYVVFKILTARRRDNRAYKYAVGLALVTALLLFWGNGAVGIIGDEDNDANVMFGGVLAVGALGALMARFRPRGMAYTLFAMALAQVVVAVIALISGFGYTAPKWPWDVLFATGFFTVLWIGSALLFRNAALK